MNSKLLRIFLLLVMSLTINACTRTSGNSAITSQSAVEKIQIGKSTKSDVSKILGKPKSVYRHGTNETWLYYSHKTRTSAKAFIPVANMFGDHGISSESSSLQVAFDQNGVVNDVRSNMPGGN